MPDNIELCAVLSTIQKELKAPKNQTNDFGKYKYRTAEGILNAVKQVLPDGCSIILSDNVVMVGGRVYVNAVATLAHGDKSFSAQAFAREPEDKKGMDASQITGAASSYARKYALNGLFGIDNTDDADSMDNRQEGQPAPIFKNAAERNRFCKKMIALLEESEDLGEMEGHWKDESVTINKMENGVDEADKLGYNEILKAAKAAKERLKMIEQMDERIA